MADKKLHYNDPVFVAYMMLTYKVNFCVKHDEYGMLKVTDLRLDSPEFVVTHLEGMDSKGQIYCFDEWYRGFFVDKDSHHIFEPQEGDIGLELEEEPCVYHRPCGD